MFSWVEHEKSFITLGPDQTHLSVRLVRISIDTFSDVPAQLITMCFIHAVWSEPVFALTHLMDTVEDYMDDQFRSWEDRRCAIHIWTRAIF